MSITDEPRPQNYVVLVILLVLLAAAVAYLVYRLVRRFVLDSDRRQVTVRAVFVSHRGSLVNPSVTDRARMAKENTNIGLENHVLVFQVGESGKELRFSFSGELRQVWDEGQEGRLTYSGRRFIRFDA